MLGQFEESKTGEGASSLMPTRRRPDFIRIRQTYRIPSMVTERIRIKNPATKNRKKGKSLESIVAGIFPLDYDN
jgi:hypothetical protein